jgi:glycosyltransferase involved in cell wall biosynthesis
MPKTDDSMTVDHSIIVPTYRCPGQLETCLAALRSAADPGWRWEVIVVDSSEADAVSANARVVESAACERFRYTQSAPLGLAAARHWGVEAARGHVLSFLDQDSLVHPDWLRGVRSVFSGTGATMAGGPCLPLYESPPPSWLKYFWTVCDSARYLGYLSLLDAGTRTRPIDPTLIFGCNLSITRALFLDVAGTHPDAMPASMQRFHGDGETALAVKVATRGVTAAYSPRCAISHLVPESRLTPEYFRRRAFLFGLEASFQATRARHGLGPSHGVPAASARPPAPSTRCGRVRGRIRSLLKTLLNAAEPAAVKELRSSLAVAHADGWRFHQSALKTDPALLEYVLRPDYMGDRVIPPL